MQLNLVINQNANFDFKNIFKNGRVDCHDFTVCQIGCSFKFINKKSSFSWNFQKIFLRMRCLMKFLPL